MAMAKRTANAEVETTEQVANEVMNISTFSREDLAGIESFDDALRLASAEFGNVATADQEIGDGFRIATEDDKRKMVGVPLMLLDWSFREGDFADYVSIHAIAAGPDNRAVKWILNDGSTGICRDLRDYTTKTGRTGGLMVRAGLRASDYVIDPESGTPLTKQQAAEYTAQGKRTAPATTFYLDTSA
jgi:hypothetical protein